MDNVHNEHDNDGQYKQTSNDHSYNNHIYNQ